jgi:hypothetical protein
MDRRTAQTIGRDKNIAGTFAYLVKTESGALQIKLIFNDLDALRSANTGQPKTEAVAIRLPVMAKYTKQAIAADIFKETAFRSFGDTLQGRSGGPSVEQQWNDFWTRELVNLTICIQL